MNLILYILLLLIIQVQCCQVLIRDFGSNPITEKFSAWRNEANGRVQVAYARNPTSPTVEIMESDDETALSWTGGWRGIGHGAYTNYGRYVEGFSGNNGPIVLAQSWTPSPPPVSYDVFSVAATDQSGFSWAPINEHLTLNDGTSDYIGMQWVKLQDGRPAFIAWDSDGALNFRAADNLAGTLWTIPTAFFGFNLAFATISLMPDGRPIIFYTDLTQRVCKWRLADDAAVSGWMMERTALGYTTGNDKCRFTRVLSLVDAKIMIAYQGYQSGVSRVYVGRTDAPYGGAFSTSSIGENVDPKYLVALRLSDGRPMVVYSDNLLYAQVALDATAAQFTSKMTVEASNGVGTYVSAFLLSSNIPAVVYYKNAMLRVAIADNAGANSFSAACPAPPTDPPTQAPTLGNTPTLAPTDAPSDAPTDAPSDPPTASPTDRPSVPTLAPTDEPLAPTVSPTDTPTDRPSRSPTDAPTDRPTAMPTVPPGAPSLSPTRRPTVAPSVAPVTMLATSSAPLTTTSPVTSTAVSQQSSDAVLPGENSDDDNDSVLLVVAVVISSTLVLVLALALVCTCLLRRRAQVKLAMQGGVDGGGVVRMARPRHGATPTRRSSRSSTANRRSEGRSKHNSVHLGGVRSSEDPRAMYSLPTFSRSSFKSSGTATSTYVELVQNQNRQSRDKLPPPIGPTIGPYAPLTLRYTRPQPSDHYSPLGGGVQYTGLKQSYFHDNTYADVPNSSPYELGQLGTVPN